MTIKYLEEYRDSELSQNLVAEITRICTKPARIMEVCGTHTMSIFKSGIKSLLPPELMLLSGPGCPVCVTTQAEIDAIVELAELDDVIIATFGDLINVPGSSSSLKIKKSEGKDIRIVYSPLDALGLAKKYPERKVIFIGVGFETTAPTIAASIMSSRDMNLDNFFVFSAHKLTPPAVSAVMDAGKNRIDGFILPGHVCVIIGENGFQPVVKKYKVPAVIAGFEPADILHGILSIVKMVETNLGTLKNVYERAVLREGNPKALEIMHTVFVTTDTSWRGIGMIPKSGLAIRKEFSSFDAVKVFNISYKDTKEPRGCACGDILTGLKNPTQCLLYKKKCTPMNPVGPCMVSSEGTCAAYYKYHAD